MELLERFGWLHEGNRLEVKDARRGLPRSVWDTYSSFANTNGGTILLGVTERADRTLEAVGLDDPEQLVKDFWDTANDTAHTSANILSEHDVRIDDCSGKRIVVVQVPRAPRELRPVYVRGNPVLGTFRRNGEGDYHCSQEDYRAMVRDSADGATDRLPLDQVGLDALCDQSVQAYRTELQAKRPNHPWCKLDRDDFLLRLGAAALVPGGTVRATRAGLLMFGWEYHIVQEFPEYLLDYREVSDERRWDHRVVSNDGAWSGNVYDFWSQVSQLVTAGVRKPFRLDGNLRRIEDTPLHVALREALANTLVHADYYGRRGVVVVRSADRVEFANPGSLRVPADVAWAGGVSDPRNPALMTMFCLICATERAGSGFDAIRAGCRSAALPEPRLSESFDPERTSLAFDLVPGPKTSRSVHHQIPGAALQPNSTIADGPNGIGSHLAVSAPRPADAYELQVVTYVMEHGSIKRVEAQEILELGKSSTASLLSGMVRSGKLVVEGKGPSTTYRLVG